MAMITAYRMKSTSPIQQVVTRKKQQWRIAWRGQSPLWILQEQLYIHIESNFDQLRNSCHIHDPTPALAAFDCPGAANDRFTREASPPSCSVPLSFTFRGEDTLTSYNRDYFESAIPCFSKCGGEGVQTWSVEYSVAHGAV